jgi:8-oxo-dGTP pyrophosphatase MutT (NUDIX family)
VASAVVEAVSVAVVALQEAGSMEITKHFTATTFVVFQNKTLLHLHRSLGMWLPPGGHIDRDELPHIAALREVKEETGLDVELIYEKPVISSDKATELPRPQHILLETINTFHQHIDLVFFARANTFDTQPQKGEALEMKWFSPDELENDPALTSDIKILGLEATLLLAN